jgi:hypothetical protein
MSVAVSRLTPRLRRVACNSPRAQLFIYDQRHVERSVQRSTGGGGHQGIRRAVDMRGAGASAERGYGTDDERSEQHGRARGSCQTQPFAKRLQPENWQEQQRECSRRIAKRPRSQRVVRQHHARGRNCRLHDQVYGRAGTPLRNRGGRKHGRSAWRQSRHGESNWVGESCRSLRRGGEGKRGCCSLQRCL